MALLSFRRDGNPNVASERCCAFLRGSPRHRSYPDDEPFPGCEVALFTDPIRLSLDTGLPSTPYLVSSLPRRSNGRGARDVSATALCRPTTAAEEGPYSSTGQVSLKPIHCLAPLPLLLQRSSEMLSPNTETPYGTGVNGGFQSRFKMTYGPARSSCWFLAF